MQIPGKKCTSWKSEDETTRLYKRYAAQIASLGVKLLALEYHDGTERSLFSQPQSNSGHYHQNIPP
jgi:hypothetical protein